MRPGLTVLERLVATARHDSEQEIHRRVEPILTPGLEPALDELLAVGPGATAAPIKTLGQETRSVARIGESITKLELLREREQWDLDAIPANRRRALAQYVRHATSQAIGRRDRTFRDPALLAFCAEAAARVTDEIVDLFDDGFAAQHAKARRALVQRKLDVADSANASVVLLGELLEILLDPEIPDQGVREAVWQRATPEELQLALELAAEIKCPLEDTPVVAVDRAVRTVDVGAPAARHEPDRRVVRHPPHTATVEIAQDLDGLEQLLAVGVRAQPQRCEDARGELAGGAVAVAELLQVRVVPALGASVRAARGRDLGSGQPPLHRPRALPHLPPRLARGATTRAARARAGRISRAALA
ncbi:MAG TPA: hypothetical protein VGO80_11165 [Solirubrobacteraceae bacterium]|nr:hypothetical protein [Solirubrobacteraceae bacterium]